MAQPDSHPTVRATHLISALPIGRLLAAAARHGTDPRPLVDALEVEESELTSFETRLPEDRVLPVLDALALAHPDLGLVAAHSGVDVHLSPLYHLSHATETMADILDLMARYMPLVWTRSTMHTELEGDLAALVAPAVPDTPGAHLLQRYLIAETCLVGPRLAAQPYPILRLSLPGEEAEPERLWAQVAEEVRFGHPRVEVVVDRATLDLPVRRPDPGLARWLEQRLDRDLSAVAPPRTAADAVAAVVRRALRRGADRSRTASRLGWSERTLGRRLAAEGTSFREVVDRVRFEACATWLGQLSVEQVAERVGFADVRSFQRAFRRWTGTTPTAWMRQAS